MTIDSIVFAAILLLSENPLKPGTFPRTAEAPAVTPPARNASSGSDPVTTAIAAPPAPAPMISPASFWFAALHPAVSAAPLAYPPAASPAYWDTSCITTEIATAFAISPKSPPFIATSAPAIIGRSQYCFVTTAAI